MLTSTLIHFNLRLWTLNPITVEDYLIQSSFTQNMEAQNNHGVNTVLQKQLLYSKISTSCSLQPRVVSHICCIGISPSVLGFFPCICQKEQMLHKISSQLAAHIWGLKNKKTYPHPITFLRYFLWSFSATAQVLFASKCPLTLFNIWIKKKNNKANVTWGVKSTHKTLRAFSVLKIWEKEPFYHAWKYFLILSNASQRLRKIIFFLILLFQG